MHTGHSSRPGKARLNEVVWSYSDYSSCILVEKFIYTSGSSHLAARKIDVAYS